MSVQSFERRLPSGIALSLACALAVRPAIAQQSLPLESVTSYRTVKVAEGIYAFITPEERSGFQSGNSIAIVGDDGVLVFDSGNIPSSTRRQIAEIRTLTDKPVKYVVNSHWHPDHHLGNSEYRAAFPGVVVIGTSATRAGILDNAPGYIEGVRGFATQDSLMKVRLSTGTMRDGSAMPENVRLMWGIVTTDYDRFLPEVVTANPSPPDLLFDDSLTIALGHRDVKVLSAGRANTAGDAFVFVPDASVLLTGDLVTRPCPFPSTAFFSDWVAALDRLKSLHALAIVPGHGDVEHDYSYVDLVRELVAYTRTYAREAVRKGVTLEQAQKDVNYSEFIARFSGGNPVRTDAFNSFYKQPSVQRAYEEAKYFTQRP